MKRKEEKQTGRREKASKIYFWEGTKRTAVEVAVVVAVEVAQQS